MLPVDQMRAAVRGLAAREQQRIAALAHERVGRQHRADAERAVAERPLRHPHHHAVDEGLVAAARAALMVVDQVQIAVPHRRPVADLAVNAFVRRGVGNPARARSFSRHGIGAEKALHPAVLVMRAAAVLGVRGLLCRAKRVAWRRGMPDARCAWRAFSFCGAAFFLRAGRRLMAGMILRRHLVLRMILRRRRAGNDPCGAHVANACGSAACCASAGDSRKLNVNANAPKPRLRRSKPYKVTHLIL